MANSNQLATSIPKPVSSAPLDRMKAFWESRNPRQRIYLGVGVAITLGAIAVIGQLMSSPDYKPLMSGMQPADAQSVGTELAAKKIPYTISADGASISVPADQVDAARLEVASHDAPHSGRIGFEIFDKVSWGETEFDEKVNYQRALEGELERTIQTMSNVSSARVHLVMATDSVFMDRERGAKASVTLRIKNGGLSRQEIGAITRLVAGAVDELKPQDVTVIDADTDQWLSANSNSPGGDDQLEQDLTKRLLATLAPIVGADNIHATVNVEYETNSSEENQEKYDPSVSVPLSMQTSEQTSSTGSAIGGVPGTSSNVPSAGAKPALPASPGDSQKTQNATYGVDRVTRHVIAPAGGIRRLTAAVVVDDAIQRTQVKGKWVTSDQKRSPDEMKLISDLAQAAIGFNTTRGDVISVQNLAFDRPPVEDIPAPGLAQRAQKGLNDNALAVRYAALLVLFGLVYLLMIRPIQKRALAVTEEAKSSPALPVAGTASASMTESVESIAHRSLLLKKQLIDFVREEPESSTTAVRAWLKEETL
jgi:flagellar M-ring protein FliF